MDNQTFIENAIKEKKQLENIIYNLKKNISEAEGQLSGYKISIDKKSKKIK